MLDKVFINSSVLSIYCNTIIFLLLNKNFDKQDHNSDLCYWKVMGYKLFYFIIILFVHFEFKITSNLSIKNLIHINLIEICNCNYIYSYNRYNSVIKHRSLSK